MSQKIEELERKLKYNPEPKNYFYLAEAYRDEGQYEKALEVCNKGLEKQPNLISANVLLAEILLKLGRLDESLKLLNEIIKRAPETTPAYKILYEAYLGKKDYKKAKDALERLFFFNPFNEEISEKLREINKIIEREGKDQPLTIPEYEPILERGSADMREELIPSLPEEEEVKKEELSEAEFLTRRIESKEIDTMIREVKEKKVEEEAFITPTMAEIYLKQGVVDKAIETYYKLYEMKNDDVFLEKAKELEERLKKASYYSVYINLLEKLLEKISMIKKGK